MEIEKKFQILSLPENLEKYPKKEIEQGYLCTTPVVRIRKSNENYILTCKIDGSTKQEENLRVNQETEVEIGKEGYEHLKQKIDGNLICKTRYILPLENGLKAELDVFHGAFEGLVFVEVEFPDVETAMKFEKPEWFGIDVSDDYHYSNSYLSTVTLAKNGENTYTIK